MKEIEKKWSLIQKKIRKTKNRKNAKWNEATFGDSGINYRICTKKYVVYFYSTKSDTKPFVLSDLIRFGSSNKGFTERKKRNKWLCYPVSFLQKASIPLIPFFSALTGNKLSEIFKQILSVFKKSGSLSKARLKIH